MIDYTSAIPDVSIPVIDPQGELVSAVLVIAVVLASVNRFRLRHRTR